MNDLADSVAREPHGGSSGRKFAEIARSLSGEPTVVRTLQRIVDLAAETIDGCDSAGVLLVSSGVIVAGAWSSELAHEIETLEYEIGEGPCVDAILQRSTFESSDLRDELSRWPTFAAWALDAGIESLLAFRLFAAEETLGALDLYGSRIGAFDESARAFGTVFAAHAALALAGAQSHEHDLTEADNLRAALVNRDVIGQAKGLLMAANGCSPDDAFAMLRERSQHQNRKLLSVAQEVVEQAQRQG